MTLPWPLVGRTEELARVRHALSRGEPGVVFVGPAGVGKTRVAREAIAAAGGSGRPTLWVVATRAASGIPLGALAGALPSAVVGAPSASRLISQAVAAVEVLSVARRALVCVDDAHLLDPTSAAVMLQLAQRNAVTVVLTMRPEAAPDAIVSLWKDDPLERSDLEVLDSAAMRELLRAALGGPVDTVSEERLLTAAAGSVLLLRHLVEGEMVRGRLAVTRGRWHWRDDGGVPQRVGDLLAAELDSISTDARQVLDLLAIAEPLPLAAVDRLAGRAAVQRAEAARLISLGDEADVDVIRLAHPLYADVLRDRLPPFGHGSCAPRWSTP